MIGIRGDGFVDERFRCISVYGEKRGRTGGNGRELETKADLLLRSYSIRYFI